MQKIKSVLLVDDDNINNFINERLIKKLELANNVNIASNGEEALLFLKENLTNQDSSIPQLILLDINMPVMDGFEFLKEYEKLSFPNKNNIVITMLTTSTNPGDMEKFNNSGVSSYVNKPLTEPKLLDIMKKHFGW
jgi:CheY-like chemotaxis protein